MKFGVTIPHYGDRANPEQILTWVRHVEQSGYDLAMVSDHVVLTPDVERLFPPPFYEAFTTLAWLAGQTEHIALGTTVIVLPYRHPLLVARMTASLAQLSGNRLVLGVAAGWAASEFAALGVDYRKRGRQTNEALATIRSVWAKEISMAPPIWVGGHSEGAMRRAVRYGDAWHPTSTAVGYLRTIGLPQLRAIAEQEDLPTPALAPRIKLRITDQPLPDRSRLVGEGSIGQLADDLAMVADLGATHVVFDTTYPGEHFRKPTLYYLEQLDQVATEVIDLHRGVLR